MDILDDEIEKFYEQYFKLPKFEIDTPNNHNTTTKFVEQFFNQARIHTLYKFISLGKNETEDDIRLNSLAKKELWFTYYKNFDDQTEFETIFDIDKLIVEKNSSIDLLKFTINCGRQLMDICSLTYEKTDRMWNDYANNHCGICLEFNIGNYINLLPIYYCNKEKLNFNKEVQYLLNYSENHSDYGELLFDADYNRFVMLPYFIKDKNKYSWEKEIRLFCGDALDEKDDFLQGIVYPNSKELRGYKGYACNFEKYGLELKDIVLGENISEVNRLKVEKIWEKMKNE